MRFLKQTGIYGLNILKRVAVDDILVFSKKPENIIEPLKTKFKYELKGVGEPKYYNGAHITKNPDTQCWEFSAKPYIKNICERLSNYLVLFSRIMYHLWK